MPKLKVAVLGAGGIIGQHMMISVPPDIEPIFVRKTPSPLAESLDLTDWPAIEAWLNERRPDVIVNLAGESRVDVVERDPILHQSINVGLPVELAMWCKDNNSHLVHVSSQAALDPKPVNAYGQQKSMADYILQNSVPAVPFTIVRPTFVLGIRPFPAIGRENPAEAMLAGTQPEQVDDRFFSISFAWDVAHALWSAALDRPGGIIHVGNTERLSRYELASLLCPDMDFVPVKQERIQHTWLIAPRPLDTTYTDSVWFTPLDEGLQRLRTEYQDRRNDGLLRRSKELAAFLRVPDHFAGENLACGFGPLHNAVSAEFRRVNPQTDAELLDWYRTTEAYLWELTAYHCDPGFNYAGMCQGIITRLKTAGAERVLCLGDGVGTLTIAMKEAGLGPVYHDLLGSRTADFATFRFAARFSDKIEHVATKSFSPGDPNTYPHHPRFYEVAFDTIASLDYLEHVPNVEEWVRVVFATLKPGGLFVAQNGFACGSGPDGAIPMHLQCNDHFEKDWDPLLREVGFIQLAPQWYQRPE